MDFLHVDNSSNVISKLFSLAPCSSESSPQECRKLSRLAVGMKYPSADLYT